MRAGCLVKITIYTRTSVASGRQLIHASSVIARSKERRTCSLQALTGKAGRWQSARVPAASAANNPRRSLSRDADWDNRCAAAAAMRAMPSLPRCRP